MCRNDASNVGYVAEEMLGLQDGNIEKLKEEGDKQEDRIQSS
jgi:hypothetical protein